ncbi:MAG: esterase [Erythrobacter sp. 34-65-8]|nr:MAG: esterase [Erythrobacter sp. 34-65-8]
MPSLSARLVNLALPLLGIRRFFAEPERLDQRIAQLRKQKPLRPRAKWHRDFTIVEDTARGYPVVTITPKSSAASAPHLFYLHGGGYVMDIAAVHWDAVLRLCAMTGASATVPVYPLAPEHKADEVLGAMQSLYLELATVHGADRITVMGDSAGGGMSLALAQMLKAEGGPLPGKLVLWSPWVDATASDPAQRMVEPKDRMLAISGLLACGERYAGDLPLDDPKVSPLFGPLEGLPPMAIFSGTSDILVVDGRRLAEKLRAIGAPHEFHEYPGMFHVWMLLPVPEGKRALSQTADFIWAGAR